MGSMVQSTVGCIPELCGAGACAYSMAQVLVGLRMQFLTTLFFSLGPVLLVLKIIIIIIIIILIRFSIKDAKLDRNINIVLAVKRKLYREES